jgi:hypothetical protein
MSLPPPPNGLMAPHCAPCIQSPLPPQQPGRPSLDVSQPNPRDTHFNNTHHPELSNNVGPFPVAASNVSRSSVQNVNPPSQPFLIDGQISSWDCIWPLLIPPLPDRSSHHSSTTQNTQAPSACPTCPTHPTSGPVQFGGGRPAPAVQDLTAPAAAAPSSSSSCPNPAAPHSAPPVPEVPLFQPGVAELGPSTANAYARRPKRMRPRRAREVPFVRIEDRIEWVSRDVMKMTLWFNWSPDAEAEAHEGWE